jgi:hypothetical protein
MVYTPARPPKGVPAIRINLYSDTQTRPSPAMREAMLRAEVGDEQAGNDPTVHALCDRAAALLGKETAVFLPSGTMCNVVAILTHCRAGEEVIAHETSHILTSEGAAHAAFTGVQILQLKGARGLFAAEDVRAAIRPRTRYAPPQRLLEVEQTANIGGGTVWPLRQLNEVAAECRALGAQVVAAQCDVADGASVDDKAFYSLTGVAIVLSGAALVAAGYWQHRSVWRALRSDAATSDPRWPVAMTAVAVVGALALSALIIIST